MIGTVSSNEKEIVYFSAYFPSGGDGTYSGYLNFPTITDNIGGGTYTNSVYTVPSDGLYQATFNFYSNSGSECRCAVFHITDDITEYDMSKFGYAGSITGVWYCKKGEKLAAGACPGYSINFYRAKNHNRFYICKIK